MLDCELSPTRLVWLERARGDTNFCEAIERDAEVERAMTRFSSADYEFEIGLNHQAELARRTLALCQGQAGEALSRRRSRPLRLGL